MSFVSMPRQDLLLAIDSLAHRLTAKSLLNH